MISPLANIVLSVLLVVIMLAACVAYWRSESRIDKIGSASAFAICFAGLLLDVIHYVR